MAGNSLGRLPRGAAEQAQAVAVSRVRREMSAHAAQVSSGIRPTFISWANTAAGAEADDRLQEREDEQHREQPHRHRRSPATRNPVAARVKTSPTVWAKRFGGRARAAAPAEPWGDHLVASCPSGL